MNSDMIYVFDKGGIKESGKFDKIEAFRNYREENEQQLNEEVKDEEEEYRKMPSVKMIKKDSSRKQSLKQTD